MGWRFWAVGFLALLALFVLGSALGVLLGTNPYVMAMAVMTGGVLRATWSAVRRPR